MRRAAAAGHATMGEGEGATLPVEVPFDVPEHEVCPSGRPAVGVVAQQEFGELPGVGEVGAQEEEREHQLAAAAGEAVVMLGARELDGGQLAVDELGPLRKDEDEAGTGDAQRSIDVSVGAGKFGGCRQVRGARRAAGRGRGR